MDQLREIVFRLPRTPQSQAFLDGLRALLAEVPYAEHAGTDRLTLTPPVPAGARPVTAFALADVPEPEVALGGVVLGLAHGEQTRQCTLPGTLDLAELTRRLSGHVRRIDHTGVNLPVGTTPAQWEQVVGTVAATTAMYRYPTGEQWPFVLPASAHEFGTGIGDFPVGREPRFELVYEQRLTQTSWQFALYTDLARAELELLFPEPEGLTFPGLADIFRVVPIRHPWPDLGIRFDLLYRGEDGPSDWETGQWLVTEGGRIPPTGAGPVQDHRMPDATTLVIRPGGLDDVATVLAFMDRATAWLVSIGRPDQWGTEPHSTNPRRVGQIEGFARAGGLWIAERDGVAVGALSVGEALPYVSPTDEPELYIQLVITDRAAPAARGVGAELLAHARELALRQRVGRLRLDCFAGGEGVLVGYYERQGFTRAETFSVAQPSGQWPGQVLTRRL
ncbi:GNAT family N-acetyltransferase [Catellatospora sp. KI3]|uniref:GNAT family N-acetyltransferase n=1 Tax=Catellatospora sp. KI3 TaxID=3041620 RepID=UPI002482B627|nr:GNAT family N-acetyltransferase [Catellatospora sp. KI3]MDI1460711.1 GNAT family N-acetyltransferase [Catellatospora sp. KI3]